MYTVIWNFDAAQFAVREEKSEAIQGLRERRDQMFDPELNHNAALYMVLFETVTAATDLAGEINRRLQVAAAADAVGTIHWPAGNPVKIEIPGFVQGLLAFGSKLYLVVDYAKYEEEMRSRAPSPAMAYLEGKCFDRVTDFLDQAGADGEPYGGLWREFLLYCIGQELGYLELLEQ